MGINIGKKRAIKLQTEVRTTLLRRRFPWAVRNKDVFVDGDPGPTTWKMTGFAAFLRGADEATVKGLHKGEITETVYKILVHEKNAPDDWHRREKDRKPLVKKLRDEAKKRRKKGTVLFDGERVPKWIAADLQKVRDRGRWLGEVISGVRTPEESRLLCVAMCGADSCPGRCAGVSSNHNCIECGPGEGAVDVTDYVTLAEELKAIGSKLHNALGPADPNHFSASGR